MSRPRAYGRSEEVLGKALAQWRGEQPFVATKIDQISGNNLPWAIPIEPEICFPTGHIRASAETSLRTLGLDHVDLIQLHVWWPTWPTDGAWMEDLQALKEDGLTSAVGVSIPDHRSDMGLPLVRSGLIDEMSVRLSTAPITTPLSSRITLTFLSTRTMLPSGRRNTHSLERVWLSPSRSREHSSGSRYC